VEEEELWRAVERRRRSGGAVAAMEEDRRCAVEWRRRSGGARVLWRRGATTLGGVGEEQDGERRRMIEKEERGKLPMDQ
jgi:hypothetical protein